MDSSFKQKVTITSLLGEVKLQDFMVFYLYISLLILVLPLKLMTDDTSGTFIDISGTSG